MHVLSDLEKGKDNPDNPEKPRGFTRLINVTEGSSDNLPPARLGGGASKWGKFLNGGPPEITSDDNQNIITSNVDIEEQQTKLPETPKMSVKPLSKFGKLVMRKGNDSIPEEDEVRLKEKSNLQKTGSQDSSIPRSNGRIDSIHNASNESSHGDSMVSLSIGETQVLTSLYHIQLQLKEEMEYLHTKISRIDDHLSEIVRMFSPSSTPCSHSSTYPNSKTTSPKNTAIHSSDQSSAESSPKRHIAPTNIKWSQDSSTGPHSSKSSMSSVPEKSSDDCSHSPSRISVGQKSIIHLSQEPYLTLDTARSRSTSGASSPISTVHTNDTTGHAVESAYGDVDTSCSNSDHNASVASMADDVLKLNLHSKLSKISPKRSRTRTNPGGLKYSSNLIGNVHQKSDGSNHSNSDRNSPQPDVLKSYNLMSDDDSSHIKDRDLDIL